VHENKIAWLVGLPATHQYRSMNESEGIYWTSDINEALWFCRRIDAEKFCEGDSTDCRIIEHAWSE
jgi:hypothetical protein